MLDRLPAWGRHAVILCLLAPLVAFVGVLALAVLSAGDVHIDWATNLDAALDAAGVSAATGVMTMVALFATPLIRAYGVGAKPEPQVEP